MMQYPNTVAGGKRWAEDVLAGNIANDDLKRTAIVWLSSPGVYSPRTFGFLERMTEEAHRRGLVDTPTAVKAG